MGIIKKYTFFMMKVYNYFTEDYRFIPNKLKSLDSDLVIYEEFKNTFTETKNYTLSRQSIVTKICEIRRKEVGEVKMIFEKDKFVEVERASFDIRGVHLDGEMTNLLFNSYKDNIQTQMAQPNDYLIGYLKQNILLMTNTNYEFFVEIATNWKELVFFLLQPGFILAAGVTNFIESAPYLLTGDNLAQLIVKVKYTITQPSIQQLFSNYKLFPNFSSITVKSILAISTIVMVPVLYICYTALTTKPTVAVASIKSEGENWTKAIPAVKVTKPSLNVGNSRAFGDFLHNLGGDIGTLVSQFTSGLLLGYYQNTKEKVEDSIEKSDSEVVIDKEKGTVSIKKTESSDKSK